MSNAYPLRDYRLDTLKTIMILGIVVEHSLLIYGYPRNHELFWGAFISWLMPMFTLISGYLYKKRSLKDLTSKYLYPMVLFSAVNFAIGYFFYDVYHDGINIIGYAMWYLWALFWFQTITPPLLKITNCQILIIVSLVAVVLFSIMPLQGTLAMVGNKLQINRIIGFYPFYLLGILLKNNDLLKTNKPYLWRLLLFMVLVLYLGLCYYFKGFAYKSGFYLASSSSVADIVQFLVSYVFIMTICVSLIMSLYNNSSFISQFGGRTLNVYLLHMIIVFPLCYGFFKQLDYTIINVLLNSLLACLFCIAFFSKKCDEIMKRLLAKQHWELVAFFYFLTLVLVNNSILTKLL